MRMPTQPTSKIHSLKPLIKLARSWLTFEVACGRQLDMSVSKQSSAQCYKNPIILQFRHHCGITDLINEYTLWFSVKFVFSAGLFELYISRSPQFLYTLWLAVSLKLLFADCPQIDHQVSNACSRIRHEPATFSIGDLQNHQKHPSENPHSHT